MTGAGGADWLLNPKAIKIKDARAVCITELCMFSGVEKDLPRDGRRPSLGRGRDGPRVGLLTPPPDFCGYPAWAWVLAYPRNVPVLRRLGGRVGGKDDQDAGAFLGLDGDKRSVGVVTGLVDNVEAHPIDGNTRVGRF